MNYNAFYAALDALIELNQEHQKECEDRKLELSAFMWAEENCTVRCDIGRCTGKTTYILNRAKIGDLIVVANQSLQHQFIKFTECKIVTADDLKQKPIGHFDKIYVNDPADVFLYISSKIFYKVLADKEAQTFIMLG